MSELEFYDGAWTGQEIDAGIGLTGTLSNALAIVVDGNKSTMSASYGQYVLVKNSTIANVSDGLYTATKTIPADTAIDATYLAAVTRGGLNDLLGGAVIPRLDDHALATTAPNDYPEGLSYMYNNSSAVPYYGMVFTIRASAPSNPDLTLPGGRCRLVQIGIPRQGMSSGTTKGLYVRIIFDGAWSPWTFISGTSV